MTSLIVVMFPRLAMAMDLRVMLSASPQDSSSTATVVLLRDPTGRPFGLPLCPGLKRLAPLLLFFQS
jgi:hypothetical protein